MHERVYMSTHNSSSYLGFAAFYNELWSSSFAERNIQGILQILKTYSTGRTVLDLACGCGHMLQKLTEHGYTAYGCDNSSEMLRYASQNTTGVQLYHYAFGEEIPRTNVEIVLCLYDSINYCESKETLQQTFKGVYSALTNGGMFLFDFNTSEGHAARWKGTLSIEKDWGVCSCHFQNDAEARTASVSITGSLPSGDTWSRFDEEHEQLSLENSEIAPLLLNTGFSKVIEVDPDQYNLQRDVGRTWLLAIK